MACPNQRLPNTLNVSFVGKTGAEILNRLEDVAASTGSACHSDSAELSPVLKAMGVPPEIGMGAVFRLEPHDNGFVGIPLVARTCGNERPSVMAEGD